VVGVKVNVAVGGTGVLVWVGVKVKVAVPVGDDVGGTGVLVGVVAILAFEVARPNCQGIRL